MRLAWTAMLLALLLPLSGCTDSPDDLDGDDTDGGEAGDMGEDGTSGSDGGDGGDDQAPREPVVITGTALAINPAGTFTCVRNGVDGDYDPVGQKVNGWSFTVEPDGYIAYWWDSNDGYLDGGTPSGTVPNGAANVEVCNETGIPGDYTVTITPPS